MTASPIFDSRTPEDIIAGWIDVVRQSAGRADELLILLPENAPLYAGRSTNETMRLKGYALAAFEHTGLPADALPYVLDELQNGRDAYLVGAAARALRATTEPAAKYIPFLLRAIENIRLKDDALTFDSYKSNWPQPAYTTALAEILATIRRFADVAGEALPALRALAAGGDGFSAAARADLQRTIQLIEEGNSAPGGRPAAGTLAAATINLSTISLLAPADVYADRSIGHVILEDQEGRQLRYDDFFRDAPAILAFFYTRCTNPNKCSLTVTKLGRLQEAIAADHLDGRLKVAAITYDPGYDLPQRLKAYGLNRGVSFADDQRFFRALAGLDDLRDYFGLGVGYGDATVNRHRIELFILDAQGRLAVSFTRLQWESGEVLARAKTLLAAA